MSEPAYSTEPAAPRRSPPSPWLGFGVVFAACALVALWLAVWAPKVFIVLAGSSLREMVTGFWGHVLGYSVLITWVGAIALHFWNLRNLKHGIGLGQFAGLFAGVFTVTLLGAQFMDGALNRFLIQRGVHDGVEYYYAAMEADMKHYTQQATGIHPGRDISAALERPNSDFPAIDAQIGRARALIAKFRRWEHQRQAEALGRVDANIFDGAAKRRAAGALNKAIDDMAPLIDKFWTLQSQMLDEDQAALAMVKDPSTFVVQRGELVFRSRDRMDAYNALARKSHITGSDIGQTVCLIQNVATGGCKVLGGTLY
jgi:uncharacterized membrane protein